VLDPTPLVAITAASDASDNAPADGSDPTLRTSEAWFNSTSGYHASQCRRSSRRRRKVCRLFRIQDIGLVRFQPPRLHARARRAAGRLLNGPDGVRGPTRAPDPAR